MGQPKCFARAVVCRCGDRLTRQGLSPGTDAADCSSSGGGSCPPNSHPNSANTACACDSGYVVNSAQTACVAGGGSSSGSSGQFTVTSGPCTLSHGGNCVGRPSQYSDSETCQISSNGAGSVDSCPVFNTERGCESRGVTLRFNSYFQSEHRAPLTWFRVAGQMTF